MSSWGDMKSETKGKFLKVKEGAPVDITILTPSEQVVHEFIHMKANKERVVCNRKACAECQEGNEPKERWKVQVYNWNEKIPQIYEFGVMVFNDIRDNAKMLEETGKTIHEAEFRVQATGSGMQTKYKVILKPSSRKVPEGLVLPKLQDSVPF